MGYVFLIEGWEEDPENIYFILRKVSEEDNLKRRQMVTLIQLSEAIVGRRKAFSAKLNKATREVEGNYYNTTNERETRYFDEEEKEKAKVVLEEFMIKKVFENPEYEGRNIKKFYQGIENTLTTYKKYLNQLIEMIQKIKPNKEEFEEHFAQNLLNQKENPNLDNTLIDKMVFEIRQYYIFNPP